MSTHSSEYYSLSNTSTDVSARLRGLRVDDPGGGRPQQSGGSRDSVSSRGSQRGRRYGGNVSNQRGAMSSRPTNTPSVDDEKYKTQIFAKRPEKTITEDGTDKVYPEKPMVISNYFKLKVLGKIKVFKYDLTYTNQNQQPMRKREDTREIFWNICNSDSYGRIFPVHTRMVFNDNNTLFTLDPLDLGGNRVEATIRTELNRKRYTMRIVFTGLVEVDTSSLDPSARHLLTEFIDSVVTQRVKSKSQSRNSPADGEFFTSFGRSIFYSPLENRLPGFDVNLGMGLQALTGLHGAVKPDSKGGLLYNVDISHTVFYKRQVNALEFAIEVLISGKYEEGKGVRHWRNILEQNCFNDTSGFRRDVRNKLDGFFKGMKFMPIYLDNRREYKYKAVCGKAASCEMFQYEGHMISVEEYFYQVFRRRLEYPFLPCLQIGSRSKVPLELLMTTLTPIRFNGWLPERVAETMIRETAWEPEKRFGAIQEMCRERSEGALIPSHLASQDVYMQNFGVSLDKTFVPVRSTVLPVPTLQFGEGVTFKDEDHNGVWSLTEILPGPEQKVQYKRVVEPLKTKIVVGMVVIEAKGQPGQIVNDMQYVALMEKLYKFGVDVHLDCQKKPKMFWRTMLESLDDFVKLCGIVENFKRNAMTKYPECIPLCIFLLPYKSAAIRRGQIVQFHHYAMIKFICDVKVGLHSQCIQKTVYDEITDNFTCSKAKFITLKIMAKIGVKHYDIERDGEHKNWTKLTNPSQPTLILGVDVTHPGAMERKMEDSVGLSIASIVGNTDIECLRYDTSVRVQRPGEERTVNMKDEIKRRIYAFCEKNEIRPAHIVLYRDGVSESAFQKTVYEEKISIKEACAEIDPEYKPTLTYIMVTKRHHTRFALPKDQSDPTNITGATNVKSGTLVEGVVTSNTYFDFFLVSHHGAMGTSRPVHYHVLYDEWQPSFAFWQTISHALTYTYVRCPSSISLPAPVVYAHLAAKRASAYLNGYTTEHKVDVKRLTSDYSLYNRLNEELQRNKDLEGMIFL